MVVQVKPAETRDEDASGSRASRSRSVRSSDLRQGDDMRMVSSHRPHVWNVFADIHGVHQYRMFDLIGRLRILPPSMVVRMTLLE